MKQIFKNFLFTKHILVSNSDSEKSPLIALSSVVALAEKFAIRITAGADMANVDMIRDAERNLGYYVPEPFYRGFPRSVLELAPAQLRMDQLYHYAQTYGMGWTDEAGHSLLEHIYERMNFEEYVTPRDFRILDETEAKKSFIEYCRVLVGSNRPLSREQKEMLIEAWKDYRADILPENKKIPCKDTVVTFLYATRDLNFIEFMMLSDVIKLLDHIQYTQYHSENLKKLNLKNTDRKFITKVIDAMFLSYSRRRWSDNSNYRLDYHTCYEKQKIWCGLLHHIHYQAPNAEGLAFVNGIRNGKNVSDMHAFEAAMSVGDPVKAAQLLRNAKGTSAVVRHLNYILSRCDEQQVKEVLSCLE